MTVKTSTGLAWSKPNDIDGRWDLHDKKGNHLISRTLSGRYICKAKATPQIVQAAAELERWLGNDD
jgi:hypothetical protein